MADYVVVMGADSDARFLPEDGTWQINDVPSPVGGVTVTLNTRWAEEGFASRVPREMWIEARGSSDTPFKDAVIAYANAAARFLPVVAFTTNAFVSDLEPKIAFEATPDAKVRPYFQSFVREERGTVPRPGRWVDGPGTAEFGGLLFAHPQVERLTRAIGQYALAIGHWRYGHEILAVAHLYIAAEALTPIAVRIECERVGTDRDGLATAWGVELKALDAEVRRRIVFRGDDKTYVAAKRASDGFEHSFLDFGHVRELSRDVRDVTAKYIRESIIDFVDVPETLRARLLEPPRDTPLRGFLTRYLWGEFIGEAENMAIEGEEYPGYMWASQIKAVERDGRTLSVTPEETMTARFNPALQFRPSKFEIFGPTGLELRNLGEMIDARVIRGDTGAVEQIPQVNDADETR